MRWSVKNQDASTLKPALTNILNIKIIESNDWIQVTHFTLHTVIN